MDTNHSLEKAIQLLFAINEPPYQYKVGELCAKTGMNRTTVYRILTTFENYGLLVRDDDRYRVGPGLYHLGIKFVNNAGSRAQLEILLDEIAEITKESVGMAVLDKDKIISVIEVEIHQPMKLNDQPGKYCTPNKGNYGKCVTAFQSDEFIERVLQAAPFEKTFPNVLTTREELWAEYRKIRERGYSTSVDELGMDILGVGIPVRNSMGQVAAGVACAFFRPVGTGYDEQAKMDFIRDVLLEYKPKLERCYE